MGYSEYHDYSETSQYWSPSVVDTNQWEEFSFDETESVYGIVVTGNSLQNAYVTSYYIMYSWDGIVYSYIENDQGERMVRECPLQCTRDIIAFVFKFYTLFTHSSAA